MKMSKVVVILLTVVVVVSCTCAYTDFCNVYTCRNKPHTMCTYTSQKPAQRCGDCSYPGLTALEKDLILNMHNDLRQKVASGKERRGRPGPQPRAKNMPILEWDEELAMVAQRWANQCNFAHDKCRDVARFQVGQNVAYKGTTGDINAIRIDDVVLMWYDEVKHFDRNNVKNYTRGLATNGEQVGHYTQFIWAKTIKIGCGAIKFKQGRWNKFHLICNYGPSGNYLNTPVYETL